MKSKETTMKAEPPHQRMVTYPLAARTLLEAEIPTAGRGKLGEIGFSYQARWMVVRLLLAHRCKAARPGSTSSGEPGRAGGHELCQHQ